MKTFLIFLACLLYSTKSYLQVSAVHNTKVENYVGDLKDGVKNGHGKMTYGNGTVYEGEWQENKKNGKGKIIDIDGTSYEGEWKEDRMVGSATITWPNGSKYVGEVSNNGMKNGKGKIIDVDGSSYEGEWKNDTMAGIATIIKPNDSRYVGEVTNNGIKNGKGTLTFANGSRFTGKFSNDKYKQGVFIDNNQDGSTYTYSGEFNNNLLYNGTRTIKFANCPVCALQTDVYKNGEWVSKEVDRPLDYSVRSDLKKPSSNAIQGTWATQADSYRGQNGQRFTFVFPGGGTVLSRVWGTDLYTDDCSIASAAVHAGLITPQSGGVITIEIRSGTDAYQGSTRNNVKSQSYGAFSGSFVFVRTGSTVVPTLPSNAIQGTWATQADNYRGQNGQRFTFVFPGGGTVSSRVWGTDLYTDDCSIASAAVHAGLITPQAGGVITIEIRPGAATYLGSTRNNLQSKDYGAFSGSFMFVRTGSTIVPK